MKLSVIDPSLRVLCLEEWRDSKFSIDLGALLFLSMPSVYFGFDM